MNCEEANKLLGAYLDGELDPVTSESIEQHLRSCANCNQAFRAEKKLARTIENSVPYYKTSPELRNRIQASLRKEIGLTNSRATPQTYSTGSALPWNWLALAAAILLTAIITWNLAPGRNGRDSDQLLATQLIAGHVRSLMAGHLTDVKSSDQHTVKPWLDERLDFAVPTVDLASQGFPLLGGRLDYLQSRQVAALIYQRRKHFINLFIWPAQTKAEDTTRTISRQGYHLLHWTDSDFNYWAVSDVNEQDLETFKQAFEQQLASR